MVSHNLNSDTPLNGVAPKNIDPYVLFEALTGLKIDKNVATTVSTAMPTPKSTDSESGYDDLSDISNRRLLGGEPHSDPRPKDLCIGAINPFALVENMLGHRLDRHSMAAARIICDTLQTDYDELFDMKHGSVLYAGLKLNRQNRRAEELDEKEMRILRERDLVTPDLSRLEKLEDLRKVGLRDVSDTRIKLARLQNGKLHLILNGNELSNTVSHREVTMTINDLCLPFRGDRQRKGGDRDRDDRDNRQGREGRFTPPNSSWQELDEVFMRRCMMQRNMIQRRITDMDIYNSSNSMCDSYDSGYRTQYREEHEHKFADPVQGATANSWLVAAIFSVFWANPSDINRATRVFGRRHGDNYNRGGNGRSAILSRDDDCDDDDKRRPGRPDGDRSRSRSRGGDRDDDDKHRHRRPGDDDNDDKNRRRRPGGDRSRSRSRDRDSDDEDREDNDRRRRRDEENMERHRLAVRFHDKGGRNNNKTRTVEVDYRVPINNSSDEPVYARSSDGYEIWPALYEKAFAKWITEGRGNNDSDRDSNNNMRVDITQTHHGDPVKAMAQINGRDPHYYFTERHDAESLVGVVRSHSVNHRTINPMVAFTHATSSRGGNRKDGDDNDNNKCYNNNIYRGANLVANHAYSVLGWFSQGQNEKQYIIVRNPWGVTEPRGFTSYPGLLDRVEPAFWPPAQLCDRDGVLAVEVSAFKEYFACLGVAK